MRGRSIDLCGGFKLPRSLLGLLRFSFSGDLNRCLSDNKFLIALAITTQNIKIFHGQTKRVHLAMAGSTLRIISMLIDRVFDGEGFRRCFQGSYFKIGRKFQLQTINIFSQPGTPIERVGELTIGVHHQNTRLRHQATPPGLFI